MMCAKQEIKRKRRWWPVFAVSLVLLLGFNRTVTIKGCWICGSWKETETYSFLGVPISHAVVRTATSDIERVALDLGCCCPHTHPIEYTVARYWGGFIRIGAPHPTAALSSESGESYKKLNISSKLKSLLRRDPGIARRYQSALAVCNRAAINRFCNSIGLKRPSLSEFDIVGKEESSGPGNGGRREKEPEKVSG